MNQRIINFSFKDIDNQTILRDSLVINTPCKWQDLHQSLNCFINKHVARDINPNDINKIIYDWQTKKKFPNGRFFFVKSDSNVGYSPGYLYKE